MFAKVPRIITSWLPRREPYELKSPGSTPFSINHSPAGLAFLIAPAGEMWSVVTESPRTARTRAPSIGSTSAGSVVHVLEKRRLAHVRRVRPRVAVAVGRIEALPALVALEDVGVALLEHLLADCFGDGVLDLLGRRPDVLQEDVLAIRALAERLLEDVDVHPSG